MPTRNHRQVKIHRNYTVEETADQLGIHKNTVREWIKDGLPVIDDRRPMLILGHELAAYLQSRRANRKQPCRPGQMYCVRCRAPRFAAGEMADYLPETATVGMLKALCRDCHSIMNRRVNLARLAQVRGELMVTFPQRWEQVSKRNQPTLNSDLRLGDES